MTERVKRKISAIMSADAVGYSALMEADEEQTVRTMESYRETISSLIEQHNGHVVDSPGDNLLSEYPSVVESVQCAVEIQHVIKAKNAVLPESRRMEFRIGIHLGDVIEEKERLYGDGINIAARIEGLADAGGICISNSAYEQIKSKLALGYEDIGEHSVKNISDPVRVYRIPMDSQGAAKPKKASAKKWRNIAFALAAMIIIGVVAAAVLILGVGVKGIRQIEPSDFQIPEKQDSAIGSKKAKSSFFDKPVVAVLPFDNMSNDPKQEYFSDSMTEEIISRLSMHTGIAVIARNSTFFYKGKNAKIHQIGKELGATYIIEGSIRKAGSIIRITAQLIDAETEKHLWAKTYERENKDIFALQDDISQQIVAAIGSADVLFHAERIRVKRKPTDNLTAYDYLLKASAITQGKYTKKALNEAKEYINKAIELDPDFSTAHLHLGTINFAMFALRWDTDSHVFENALKEVKKAVSLDNSDPFAHAWLANLYRWQSKFEKAMAEVDRALILNPNYDLSYLIKGAIVRDSGKPEEAIDYIKKSMRLNPHHDANYYTELADAYFLLGRYNEMVAPLQKAIARNPQWMPSYNLLSRAYRSLGQYKLAIEYANEGIAQNPEWVWTYVALAYSYLDMWTTQQQKGSENALDNALKAAKKCTVVADNPAICDAALSITYLWQKKYDLSIRAAKDMAGFYKTVYSEGLLSHIYSHAGMADLAAKSREKSILLNAESLIHRDALINSLAGRYEEAVAAYKNGLGKNPSFEQSVKAHIGLAAMYSELDRIDEAKAEAAKLLKLVPNFSVDVWGERVPYKDPALAERDMAALRKAGLK